MSLHTNKLLSLVNESTDVLVYKPTADQRRAKSAFWSHFTGEGATQVPTVPTLASALSLGGDRRISDWWKDQSFIDWFSNSDEFRQRLEYLTTLALDAAEDILTSKDAPAAAKVNMAKLVMEAAGKGAKDTAKEKYADERIAQMDRMQLEEYIRKSMRILPPVNNQLTSPEESEIIEVDSDSN